MSYSRSFTVERASVNEETGEFRAVLFTDGEATDGHMLNIAGGKIPERMPLFVNHRADPREQLGSLFFDRTTPHQVHVRGQIFLDGDGNERAIRRDIMAKIAAGHVSRMSGRWDADPANVKRRADLPSDHPAYVGEKAKGAKRYGLYFDKWEAMEGSIVGLGADPQATMRWAEDESLPEPVRAFYRQLAEDADAADEDVAEPEATKPAERILTTKDVDGLMADLAGLIKETVAAEFAARDTAPAEGAQDEAEAENERADDEHAISVYLEDLPVFKTMTERLAAAEARLAAYEEGREIPSDPPPLATLPEIIASIRTEMAEARRAVLSDARAIIDEKRGKITDERMALRKAIDACAREVTKSDEPTAPNEYRVLAEIVAELRKAREAELRSAAKALAGK